MAPFNELKAYAKPEDVYFDDGREVGLLHAVYSRPDIDELRGSPERVLAAIDEYARRKYLMNVGEHKGAIIVDLIAETKPRVMVELGSYVGYSAVLFGSAVQRAGGQRYVCLERSPEFAAVARSMIDLAGLGTFVEVVVGAASASLRRLHAQGRLPRIDVLFLDHYKPLYLPDLQLCEQLGLVRPGTVLVADNVVSLGNPTYLAYVRSPIERKRQGVAAPSAGTRGFNSQYLRQHEEEGGQSVDAGLRGDPNLAYSSQLFDGFEPTGVPDGVEITRCVGREP